MKYLAGILLALAFISPVQAKTAQLPTTVWVDDDGVEAKALNVTSFKTINEGIEKVAVGGVVLVLPGTYGSVRITKSVNLQARLATGREPNPKNNPENNIWPVVIEGKTGDGIVANEGLDGVTIRGFHVRNFSENGIHIMGNTIDRSSETPLPIKDLCEGMKIYFNKIDNVGMDGVKAHQCDRIRVAGNTITNTSMKSVKRGGGELEQGIDFVGVGNSVISNNIFGKNEIGVVAKAGSVNISITGNKFLGPFKWVAVSAEPSGEKFILPSARKNNPTPYQLKNLVVKNNIFEGAPVSKNNASKDIVVRGCQNCTYRNNTMPNGIAIGTDPVEKTLNVCVSPDVRVQNPYNAPVKISNTCKDYWPPATIKRILNGYDIGASN